MIIYQDTTDQFVHDVKVNRLTDVMAANFKSRWGRVPIASEQASWQNSLPRVRDLIEIAGLTENRIALEYEVPYSRQNRIDCLLFGKGADDNSNVVQIELKQWSTVRALEDEGNFVETFTGGKEQIVPHPSQQVKGYHNYLKGFVSEFDEHPPLVLFSCSYCHNYEKKKDCGLYSPVYKQLVCDYPIYCKSDTIALADKIKELLAYGDGFEIFNRFMQSPIRPTKKLLDNVSKVIKNEVVFSLLNEQLVAKNLIWSKVNKAEKNREKSVIIVHGGPGTGKSVIAINILAEAAQRGKKVFYGCKSKPFTEGLKSLVRENGAQLFSNLYRFLPSIVSEDELDLLLIDEAHRIEKTSNHQYTKPADRTEMPQVDQLVRCANTSVFFIDDKQNVRYQEIGNSATIKVAAKKYGCTVSEVTLLAQYRCMGSNDYLLWLESVLGYTDERRTLRKNEIFDFKIFDSPQAIYDALQTKENEKPNSARMVAGFCWPWSQKLDVNGELVKDVRIGDFAMPWETHGKITRLPKGFVKWYEWAYRPEGFKQVGCIYTAQGFEFDYVGVIIGNDLCYGESSDRLAADITATHDPTLRKGKDHFEHHVKNIYRTLLSRGMKGCYVYFTNKKTEQFFKNRMESVPIETALLEKCESAVILPFRRLQPKEVKPFENCVPLYDLKIAAGQFSDEQQYSDIDWVALPDVIRPRLDLFVIQVVGESMNRRIPNGSWCLFKKIPAGSRQGKVVLVRHREISDTETGGHYTVKIYESQKKTIEDGTWQHTSIVLRPDTTSQGYSPIVLDENQSEELQVIGEFVAVLG
ncbi:MAG: DUF2075 domain-containing protein [Deltaproteobacteria bacterium]|nr:DUF2075 domain-containing protein [Deltaproteobacteria bacterium]